MHASEYLRIEQLESTHFWYRAMEEWSLQILERYIPKNARILDAGCGTGGMTKKLARFGNVIGVDVNNIALSFARKKGISVKNASVCDLPFRDNTFDAVVSFDVLYHKGVQDDKKALSEFYRVLRTGGIVFLRNPAFEWLRGTHDVTVQTRHRYTMSELREKCEEVGFEIQKITYANMMLTIPLFVKRFLERKKKVSPQSGSDTVPLPRFLNEVCYRYLVGENAMLQFVSFPFGSSVVCVGRKPLGLGSSHR